MQTRDDGATDYAESLSAEASRAARDSPTDDDFVRGRPGKTGQDLPQSATDLVSDSNTSVEHLAEIVRQANRDEKQATEDLAEAEVEAAHQGKEKSTGLAKERAESDKSRNEALGDEGLQYLQNMAQNIDKA